MTVIRIINNVKSYPFDTDKTYLSIKEVGPNESKLVVQQENGYVDLFHGSHKKVRKVMEKLSFPPKDVKGVKLDWDGGNLIWLY